MNILNPRVLLVENTTLEAIKVEVMLETLGCIHLKTINNAMEAYHYAVSEKPDLIISDIYLEGELTGIDLKQMLSAYSIPFILITASQDISDYAAATKLTPTSYLVKPFHLLSLKSTMDLLFTKDEQKIRPSIFIRDYLNKQVRVFLDEILILESDRNDCFIYTTEKKYVIKRSLSKMSEALDERFCRIHASFIVNLDLVVKIESESILIANKKIPIGRAHKKSFLEKLNLKNGLHQ